MLVGQIYCFGFGIFLGFVDDKKNIKCRQTYPLKHLSRNTVTYLYEFIDLCGHELYVSEGVDSSISDAFDENKNWYLIDSNNLI